LIRSPASGIRLAALDDGHSIFPNPEATVKIQRSTLQSPVLFRASLLSLAALLVACGGSGSGSSSPGGGGTPNQIVVGNGSFSPSTLSVKAGTTVTFAWTSSGHPLVFGSGCTPATSGPSAGVNSGSVQNNGQQFVVPSNITGTAGTYPFYCTSHCATGMTGTLTITP
jgi:plastocyanin